MSTYSRTAARSDHIASHKLKTRAHSHRTTLGWRMSIGIAALYLFSSPLLAATAPDLATVSPYGIVSSTFTNTTAGTTINGNVCYTTSPAVAAVTTGTIVVPCLAAAGADQNTARADLVSQSCTPIGAAVALNDIVIGGGTPGVFPPGCYSSTGAMSITTGTTVTLNGTGAYIFRSGGALDPGANTNVVAAGGACINEVFWAPEGATTIGANANFIGTIFRGTADGLSITFGDSSTLIGRALAYGSTVTTANTTISVPDDCISVSTITVNKDFSPNSIATVPVSLTCTSGTVVATPLNASEALPAVFTVNGASPGATCTATETVPTGYTANQANCVGVALDGSCQITNTLNSDTIVVNKDFIPNSIGTVPVSLTCTSGTVTVTPLNASEALPAVFTVTGASPGATCTATETVPVGYTANQGNCVGVAVGGSCQIINTLNSDTIVVNKDFSPNSLATVPVALTCTSGTVTTTPLNAAEGAPAVFTVTGASPGATCTATETVVPMGYTANQASCVGVALGGSCQITNTLNSDTIVVNKNFIPNSIATVPVALTCTSGTVTASPLNASEALPAVFTVTGASPGATCTAAETVPVGYTANQTNCVGVALGGSCEITNTVNSDTIVVYKDFAPDSLATVEVALNCSSGTVTTTPLNAAEGAPAVFTVTGASPGAACTATETVPVGYTANQADCADVELGGSCIIRNSLDSNTITVIKDFSPNSVATVPVSLTCTSGTVAVTPLNASEALPAVFTVNGASPGATCTAMETVPTGYTANQANCVGVALGGSCQITNTLNSNTIVVNKDFIPNSIGTVPVSLTCTSGTVTATPLNAAEGAPAVFTVTGASPGATCTATETPPAGYVANQTDCVSVELGGSCEITNTLNSNTIVVNKDFSPNSIAAVPVSLTCTTGAATVTPLNAAEGAPAVFIVTGASPGATCTATETVPAGYAGNEADCVDVPLGGSCEIINVQINPPGRATFRVIKDFTDNNPRQVEVALDCNTGLLLDQVKNISEAKDVEFVVTSFGEGELHCDVTEKPSTGYSPTYTAAASTGLGLVSDDPEGCHFDEVVSGQFVCHIVNAPGMVDIEIEKLWIFDSFDSREIDTRYSLTLYCDAVIEEGQEYCHGVGPDMSAGGIGTYQSCKNLSGNDSATFVVQVLPDYPNSHCWVSERVYDNAVEIRNDCGNIVISAGVGASCLITNTAFFEGIPMLGENGLAILALLMLGLGVVGLRRMS